MRAILLAALAAFFVCGIRSDELPQSEWVKGAVVVGINASGGCVFKPFVQTGTAGNDPDDDSPQILGYSPGNVQVDKQGRVVFERVAESSFIPLHRWKSVHGRLCKCPPYEE